MSSEVVELFETIMVPADKIDREKGVARDVKILGRVSANGREYTDGAFDDAVKLYENAEVNVDHDRKEPDRERGLLEGFGQISQPYKKTSGPIDGQGVFGTLNYLTKHPMVPLFLERIDKGMTIGLSHNAAGKAVRRGSKTVIESISRVKSVDLVRNPATNKNLFESRDRTVSKTFREIIEANFPQTSKDCVLLEDAGMSAMPVDMPAESSADDQIWAAFKQAVLAAVDDDSLDIKATLKKIGDILKAYDKLTGADGKSSGGDTPPAGDTPTPESKSLANDPALKALIESVNRLTKREEARGIAEECGVTCDSALLESLVKLPDAKAMKELLEREKTVRRSAEKPSRSSNRAAPRKKPR